MMYGGGVTLPWEIVAQPISSADGDDGLACEALLEAGGCLRVGGFLRSCHPRQRRQKNAELGRKLGFSRFDLFLDLFIAATHTHRSHKVYFLPDSLVLQYTSHWQAITFLIKSRQLSCHLVNTKCSERQSTAPGGTLPPANVPIMVRLSYQNAEECLVSLRYLEEPPYVNEMAAKALAKLFRQATGRVLKTKLPFPSFHAKLFASASLESISANSARCFNVPSHDGLTCVCPSEPVGSHAGAFTTPDAAFEAPFEATNRRHAINRRGRASEFSESFHNRYCVDDTYETTLSGKGGINQALLSPIMNQSFYDTAPSNDAPVSITLPGIPPLPKLFGGYIRKQVKAVMPLSVPRRVWIKNQKKFSINK